MITQDNKPTEFHGRKVGERLELVVRVMSDPRTPQQIRKEDRCSLKEAVKRSAWFEYEKNGTKNPAANFRSMMVDEADQAVELICFGDAIALADGWVWDTNAKDWLHDASRILKPGMLVRANGYLDFRAFDSKNWGLVWQPQLRLLQPTDAVEEVRPERPTAPPRVTRTTRARRSRQAT